MIQVETRLELALEQPMDALFHLGAHPDRLDRLCGSEVITATQTDGSTLDLHSDMFFDPFGNPVIRARLLPGTTTIDYAFRGTASSAFKPADDLPFIAVNDLPSNVLQYLKPSRYVDSDRVGPLAFEIIGDEVMAGRQTHRLFEWSPSMCVASLDRAFCPYPRERSLISKLASVEISRMRSLVYFERYPFQPGMSWVTRRSLSRKIFTLGLRCF